MSAVVPEGYQGLKLTRGEALVLFAEADNRSPVARSAVAAHRLQAGGPSAEVVLRDHFDDPDGDSLAFSVATMRSRKRADLMTGRWAFVLRPEGVCEPGNSTAA